MSETPGQARSSRAAVVDLEERRWLARHCQGDLEAFPALLNAYRRPVHSYLVRNGIAPADRDDLFQTIFLKIHAAAPSYDAARPLAPWLFTIVANTVRNHLREDRLRARYLDEDRAGGPALLSVAGRPNEGVEIADPQPGPEQIVATSETVAWLEQALLTLAPAQREVLLLTTVGGLRQQDVAQVLGLPVNTVKTHLRRARLALTKALAERDAPPDPSGETP